MRSTGLRTSNLSSQPATAALDMGDAVELFVSRHPETSPVAALAQLLLQLRQSEAQQLSQAERSLALLRSDLRAAAAGRQQLQNKLASKDKELGLAQNQARSALSCRRGLASLGGLPTCTRIGQLVAAEKWTSARHSAIAPIKTHIPNMSSLPPSLAKSAQALVQPHHSMVPCVGQMHALASKQQDSRPATERDEALKQSTDLRRRHCQFQHELKRREQEYERLQV